MSHFLDYLHVHFNVDIHIGGLPVILRLEPCRTPMLISRQNRCSMWLWGDHSRLNIGHTRRDASEKERVTMRMSESNPSPAHVPRSGSKFCQCYVETYNTHYTSVQSQLPELMYVQPAACRQDQMKQVAASQVLVML